LCRLPATIILPDAARLPTSTGDADKLARLRHFRTVDWDLQGALHAPEQRHLAGAGTTAPPFCAFRWVGAPLVT